MRAFVAAWPDAATRAALAELQQTMAPRLAPARPMQPRNLHLTLAFIGEIESSTAAIVAAAIEVAVQGNVPLAWKIDRTGCFERARVVWAGAAATPSLAAAAERVRGCLDRLAVGYDRKPFVPHVTLYRDARRFVAAGPIDEPIDWHTELIALHAAARDDDGPCYRRVVPGADQGRGLP
jgi:RNA 2',3'-cyclic 3'-phosphodiesterase